MLVPPTIDWCLRDEKSKKNPIVNDVRRACKEFGCFYLVNHYVTDDLLKSVEFLCHKYFSLPLNDKMKTDISKSVHHRGYFSIGYENAKGKTEMDFKEGFDIALDLPLDDPDVIIGKPLHGPNVWPMKPENFHAIMQEFYNTLKKTAEDLSSVIAEAIGLPPDHFYSMTTKPLAQLRILHYPPSFNKHKIGAGTHTDYGIVTLLWQDNIGGLEIQAPNGNWIAVPPISGALFCNIGDVIQRITNDKFKATVHRVMNKTKCSRYSAAFFFDPNYDSIIESHPKFLRDKIPKYSPIRMGEYIAGSFDSTFAYRKIDKI